MVCGCGDFVIPCSVTTNCKSTDAPLSYLHPLACTSCTFAHPPYRVLNTSTLISTILLHHPIPAKPYHRELISGRRICRPRIAIRRCSSDPLVPASRPRWPAAAAASRPCGATLRRCCRRWRRRRHPPSRWRCRCCGADEFAGPCSPHAAAGIGAGFPYGAVHARQWRARRGVGG